MHHLSNKNNPQGQGYFSSHKDLKKKKIRARSHFLAITQTTSLALYFLNGMCNAKGLKNASQAPAQNPNGESEAKREKGENINLLLRVGGYHQLPMDICKCWWMTGPSRNSALIPAPKCTQEENMQSPLSQESSLPQRVTEHEVDSIWRRWTGQMECWHHSL